MDSQNQRALNGKIVSHVAGGWGSDRQARIDAAEALAKAGWSPDRIEKALGLTPAEQRGVREEVRARHEAFAAKVKELTRVGVDKGMDGGSARRQAEVEAIKWFTKENGRKPDMSDLSAGGIRLG